MNILQIEDKFYTPKIIEIGRIFFYIGLFCELIIIFLDRLDWHNPYQSYMFRVTFLFFVIKCICTRYDAKQWLFILCTGLLCFITYRISGKDEVIRAMVFIIAMKDLDVKRTLKFNYWGTLVSVCILALLALLGVCGDVLATPGYNDAPNAFLVSLGLGSSNTWGIQIWLLTALAVYIYHDRIPSYSYGLISILGIIVFYLSKCRTELLMMLFTAACGFILAYFKKIRDSKIIYILGAIGLSLSIGISVYAAKISTWWDFQTPLQRKIDLIFTGRVTCIYAFENGGGVLSNWKPFGAMNFVEYFDMGWVRLFWWYGYIPGILAVIGIFILIYYQYKLRDYSGLLLIVSMILFTVIEAHFISVFLLRNYMLFLIGGIWYKIIGSRNEDTSKHISFYIGSLAKGGAERVFCNLAEYFVSIGWQVTMITQYKYEDEYELPNGVNRVLSDLTKEESKGRIYNLFARIFKLHRIIRDTNSDILMTTIGKANFMAIACAIFTKTRVVVSVVADPKEEYPTKIMRFLLQTMFGDADGIIMQTTDQTLALRPALRRISTIMPNSVSPNFIKPRFTGRRSQDIYMVGRMDDNKNQKMAIEAFGKIYNKYPESRLHLIGGGTNREMLEELSKSMHIEDRVIFEGIISNVYDVIYEGYAFLLTSNTEGMPNTLLEAMSLGLACISTDCPCGGPKDIIRPNENGILVPVGDSDALGNALDQLLSDYDYADKLGKTAYEDLGEYAPDVVNAKWRDFYLGIIG